MRDLTGALDVGLVVRGVADKRGELGGGDVGNGEEMAGRGGRGVATAQASQRSGRGPRERHGGGGGGVGVPALHSTQ